VAVKKFQNQASESIASLGPGPSSGLAVASSKDTRDDRDAMAIYGGVSRVIRRDETKPDEALAFCTKHAAELVARDIFPHGLSFANSNPTSSPHSHSLPNSNISTPPPQLPHAITVPHVHTQNQPLPDATTTDGMLLAPDFDILRWLDQQPPPQEMAISPADWMQGLGTMFAKEDYSSLAPNAPVAPSLIGMHQSLRGFGSYRADDQASRSSPASMNLSMSEGQQSWENIQWTDYAPQSMSQQQQQQQSQQQSQNNGGYSG
jgi:hypothetical protein